MKKKVGVAKQADLKINADHNFSQRIQNRSRWKRNRKFQITLSEYMPQKLFWRISNSTK